MNTIEGSLNGEGLTIGIVISRFNQHITQKLLEGANATLLSHGVNEADITVVFVPGAFEIPVLASHLAYSSNYDGLICLGAVVKGETDHYEYVASQTSKGILDVSIESGIPVAFGVLTTLDMDQAFARSGGDKGNIGSSCAETVIETINTIRNL
ncbi:MAG: 6,7-dimethyl-8-ribityllumazine synthase [Dehalococcoidia bacterium]|mgnify:FL=1|nr:6,7-dimethyl-8-ribityllumazine synthase [Dehalococcoidia bacterium]|tara:strand:+ start:179 stop:640 length:462 start_codon:yes stop_codon:yes gene_type:complete